MTKVNEVFEFAIANEFNVLAHSIYWALSQKLVSLNDDSQKLIDLNFDKSAIQEIARKNVLGMGKVKLFTIECKNNWYAFYFAKDIIELGYLHRELFGQKIGKIVEAKRLLYSYFEINGEEVLLIDYRNRFIEFPVYIGHAKAKSHVLVKFERVKKVV